MSQNTIGRSLHVRGSACIRKTGYKEETLIIFYGFEAKDTFGERLVKFDAAFGYKMKQVFP